MMLEPLSPNSMPFSKVENDLKDLHLQISQLGELMGQLSAIQERSDRITQKLIVALDSVVQHHSEQSSPPEDHDSLVELVRRSMREQIESYERSSPQASERVDGLFAVARPRVMWIAVGLGFICISLFALGSAVQTHRSEPSAVGSVDPIGDKDTFSRGHVPPQGVTDTPESERRSDPMSSATFEADGLGSVTPLQPQGDDSVVSEAMVENGPTAGSEVPSGSGSPQSRLPMPRTRSAGPLLIAPPSGRSGATGRDVVLDAEEPQADRRVLLRAAPPSMEAEGRFEPTDATDRIIGVTAHAQSGEIDSTSQAPGLDQAIIAPQETSPEPDAQLSSIKPEEVEPSAPDARPSVKAKLLSDRSEGVKTLDTTATSEAGPNPGQALAIQPEVGIQLQRNLKRLGLYDAAIDGQIGRMTKVAIQQFQESIGVEPTGDLTPDQMFLLAQAAERTATVPDGESLGSTGGSDPGR